MIDQKRHTANTTGHVREIEDKQAVIVRVLAGYSNAVTAIARGDIGVINPNMDKIVIGVD